MSGYLSRRSMLAATAASASLGYARIGRAQQGGAIKIGVVMTQSTPLGELGNIHVLGAKLAAKHVNESGGIDGRMIELVTRDARFSASDTIAAVRELAGSGINLILGDPFSQDVLAILPLLDELAVVYCTPGTILMEVTHEKYNRHFFRAACNARGMYGGSALVMAKTYPAALRWSAVLLDVVGAHAGWAAFQASLKRSYAKYSGKQVEIIEPLLVKLGVSNFRDQITQLMSMNLDGIHVGITGSNAITFYQQAQPFGLFNRTKAVADTIVGVQTGPTLKNAVPKNFWTYCQWTIETYGQFDLAQRFNKDFIAESKRPTVDPPASESHSVIMGLATAMKQAKGTGTDAVISALESIQFDSVFGRIGYRKEDHQLLFDPGYLHVEPQDGEPGYRNVGVVTIPYQEIVEPPSPGVPYHET